MTSFALVDPAWSLSSKLEISLILSSDGDIEETTSEMESGIGKEPRKPQQRVGTGPVMRRWIMTGQNRREGMFGCGRSLADVTQESVQENRYTYNSIISMSDIQIRTQREDLIQ